jgi:hypothetical protein
VGFSSRSTTPKDAPSISSIALHRPGDDWLLFHRSHSKLWLPGLMSHEEHFGPALCMQIWRRGRDSPYPISPKFLISNKIRASRCDF